MVTPASSLVENVRALPVESVMVRESLSERQVAFEKLSFRPDTFFQWL